MTDKIISLIIGIFIGSLLIWINLTYVKPYGMMGEGFEYCKVLSQEGYFEGQWDTADHKNCTIGYEEGQNKEKRHWVCPYRTDCFSFDDYNDTCELDIDMKDYGKRCVWGGLGYFTTMLTIMLWGLAFMILFMVIGAFFIKPKEEKKDEIERYRASLQRSKA